VWQTRTFWQGNQDFENDDPSKTEYGLGWLPLGGYVKIAGMVDESFDKEQMKQPPQPWEFRSKPAWQRLIIMLGGVTVNFILGFLIFGFVLWGWGEEFLPAKNVTYGIWADSVGVDMGLRDGDQILAVGGQPFEKFSDRELVRQIVIDGAKDMLVARGEEKVVLPIDPKYVRLFASHEFKNKGVFGARFPNVVGEVSKGLPAEKSGILKDDRIVSLNGKPMPFFHEFAREIRQHKSEQVAVGLIRGDRDTLVLDITTTAEGTIGFAPYGPDKYFTLERKDYSLASAIPAGVSKGWKFLSDQVKAFGHIFSGKISASESLGGFGTFAKLYGFEWDWERFWNITAIISLILAFMNLLPIPALDGGHVMFLLWEVVTGRKPSDKFMEYATTAGFILLIGLMIYANGLDVLRGCSG
jgi:regulator of sigma E protease